MRKFFAAVALAFPLPGLAASSFSPDASDLWWNSNESGWDFGGTRVMVEELPS